MGKAGAEAQRLRGHSPGSGRKVRAGFLHFQKGAGEGEPSREQSEWRREAEPGTFQKRQADSWAAEMQGEGSDWDQTMRP